MVVISAGHKYVGGTLGSGIVFIPYLSQLTC